MNRRKLFAVLVVYGLPGAALAAPAPAWTVDKAASSVRFTSSMGGESFSGAFRRWDADIRFDPANLGGSSVAASIDATSAVTGSSDRDQALPTSDFFSATKFPRAIFTAHAFTALGPGRYQAVGQLTLRGVSKPLTLPFTLVITGSQAKMNASVALNRLAFGVGQGQWSSTEAIPNPVTVTIALTAKRAN
jgi:polyisoprenoid-binding protein YceI